MREFNYRFEKGLFTGLRPTDKLPLNYQHLAKLINLKAGEAGIEAPYTINKISNTESSTSWPYAQIFLGSYYTIVAFPTVIYRIDSDLATLFTTLNPTNDSTYEYDLTSYGSNISVSAGTNPWEFVDYGKYFILTNGTTVVYSDLTDLNNPVLATSADFSPTCVSYTNFRGQLIGGNVTTSWHSCGDNSVVWSKIGSIVMTPSMSGESGFKNITEWQGQVHCVKGLRDRVVVYGNAGIIAMVPADAMFGWEMLSSVGLYGAYAIGGDEYEHVFADSYGVLWRMQRVGDVRYAYAPKRLGYEEFIQPLSRTALRISKDSVNSEYYISDGTKSYLLTDQGLSELTMKVGSVISHYGRIVGAVIDGSYSYGLLETGPLDTKSAGFKTVVAVELGVTKTTGVSVAIKWRNVGDASFKTTAYYPVNDQGVAYPRISASEICLVVKVTDPAGFKLDYANIRMNLTDRRSVRGVLDVNETAG